MENNSKWSSAAMDGLYLSLVSIIYSLAGTALPSNMLLTMILWLAKTAGCIYLLWFFMKRWSGKFDAISYGESFNYGFTVCMFSSVMCACFNFVQVEWIFPEHTEEVIALTREAMAQQNLDSAAENMMEKVFSNFGRITLFTTLVYYTLYGAVASAITANFTKQTNPFGNTDGEE